MCGIAGHIVDVELHLEVTHEHSGVAYALCFVVFALHIVGSERICAVRDVDYFTVGSIQKLRENRLFEHRIDCGVVCHNGISGDFRTHVYCHENRHCSYAVIDGALVNVHQHVIHEIVISVFVAKQTEFDFSVLPVDIVQPVFAPNLGAGGECGPRFVGQVLDDEFVVGVALSFHSRREHSVSGGRVAEAAAYADSLPGPRGNLFRYFKVTFHIVSGVADVGEIQRMITRLAFVDGNRHVRIFVVCLSRNVPIRRAEVIAEETSLHPENDVVADRRVHCGRGGDAHFAFLDESDEAVFVDGRNVFVVGRPVDDCICLIRGHRRIELQSLPCPLHGVHAVDGDTRRCHGLFDGDINRRPAQRLDNKRNRNGDFARFETRDHSSVTHRGYAFVARRISHVLVGCPGDGGAQLNG